MSKALARLIKGSSIYTIGNFLSRALSMVSMPIMTRYLSTSEYGTLSMANVLIGILSSIYSLGSASFAIRHYYDFGSGRERKEFFGSLFLFLVGTGFTISLLLTGFGEPLFKKLLGELPFKPYVVIGIWICFLGVIPIIPEAFFLAREQAFFYASLNFLRSVLGVALSILLVAGIRMGALGPLTANLIISMAFGLYFLYYLSKEIKLDFSPRVVKQCLSFSLPVLVLLLGRTVTNSMETLILQKYVQLSVIGIYSVAVTAASVLVMLAASFDTAWTPFFYSTAKEKQLEEAKNTFSLVGTYVLTIYLMIALSFIIFRHELVAFLAPPSYFGAIAIIPLLMLGAIFSMLSFIPMRGIVFEKKTNRLILVTLVSFCASLGLNILLVPRYHMFGAAIANVLSNLIILCFIFFLSQRIYRIRYEYGRVFHVFVIFGIIGGLSYFDNRQMSLSIVASRLLLYAAFVAALFATKFFNKKEILMFRNLSLRSFIRTLHEK
jgi:O-antigen/teichoic acid export membrane protein